MSRREVGKILVFEIISSNDQEARSGDRKRNVTTPDKFSQRHPSIFATVSISYDPHIKYSVLRAMVFFSSQATLLIFVVLFRKPLRVQCRSLSVRTGIHVTIVYSSCPSVTQYKEMEQCSSSLIVTGLGSTDTNYVRWIPALR